MAQLLKTKSLNYSDVNLIGQAGVVNSRTEIPIEGFRIVVSAMSSIIGPNFLKACAKLPEELRPSIHVPRDIFQEENLKLLSELKYSPFKIFVGVGFKTEIKIFKLIKELGYNQVLLDIANGYIPLVKDIVKELKNHGFIVCTGSVHTEEGYSDLLDAGVSIVRSGIGPGSVCITADSTGFTRGTFTEIFQMAQQKEYKDEHGYDVADILADGGFKSTSDFVKSFLAGADYCMSGSIFKKVKEARLHTEEGYGKLSIPKQCYFGMASPYGKLCMDNKIENIEGNYEFVSSSDLVSLEELLTTLWAGIKSGVSYSGYATLTEAIGNGVFEVKG